LGDLLSLLAPEEALVAARRLFEVLDAALEVVSGDSAATGVARAEEKM
jgi:hypothetical protein